jgi:hypothetical protein
MLVHAPHAPFEHAENVFQRIRMGIAPDVLPYRMIHRAMRSEAFADGFVVRSLVGHEGAFPINVLLYDPLNVGPVDVIEDH